MIDDQEFQDAFRMAIEQIAQPLFAASVEKADTQGVVCSLENACDEPGYPNLCLRINPLDPARHSSYTLRADTAQRTVIHQQAFNDGQELKMLDTSIESINRTVIEAELVAFFEKAAQCQVAPTDRLEPFRQ